MKKLLFILLAASMFAACNKQSKPIQEIVKVEKVQTLKFAATGDEITFKNEAELKQHFASRSVAAYAELHNVQAKKKAKLAMNVLVVSPSSTLTNNITGVRIGTLDRDTVVSGWGGQTTYYRSVAAFDQDGTFHESDIYQLRYLPCTNLWLPLSDTATGSRIISPGEYKRYWSSMYAINCATGEVYEVYGELILQ